MSDDRLYDAARDITDEVFGPGTYADMNADHPDPQVQAAIGRGQISVLHWALREALSALDAGDVALARRYLDKLDEQMFCRFCREPVMPGQEGTEAHWKAVVHSSCLAAHRARSVPG